MANIFSPQSAYTYGQATANPSASYNVWGSTVGNPYITQGPTYTPLPPVQTPITSTPAPVQPVVVGGDSFPGDEPPAPEFTGFGFGNNNTGYTGPYNQGSPLADLQQKPGFSFGNFNFSLNPGNVIGGWFGGPIGSAIGGSIYNNWDKKSFATPTTGEKAQQFSNATTPQPTSIDPISGLPNYSSADDKTFTGDGDVNWGGMGNPQYVTIDGIGVENPDYDSGSSYGDGITDEGGYGSYDMSGYGEDIGVSDF